MPRYITCKGCKACTENGCGVGRPTSTGKDGQLRPLSGCCHLKRHCKTKVGVERVKEYLKSLEE